MLDELRAELKQLADLIRTLADHVAGLSSRVERGTFQTARIANASEDTNALALTEVRESRAEKAAILKELQEIHEQLAVLVDNVKDAEGAAGRAEVAAREATGAHPIQPLDIDDTDKRIGKAVRWAWNTRPIRWAVGLAGGSGFGAGVMHLLHRWHVLQ